MNKMYRVRDVDHRLYREIVKELNEEAKGENPTWRRYYNKYYKALLLITGGHSGWKPIGYLMWTARRAHVKLNQIWIEEEYRRQGAGSFFVQAWYEQITARKSRTVFIESPKKEMILLLLKIGYIDPNPEKAAENKVHLC